MAKKIVVKKAVTRKKGMLYFVDGSGNVVETKMNRKGGKKGRHVCKASAPAKKRKAPRKKAAKKRVTRKKVAAKRVVRRKR